MVHLITVSVVYSIRWIGYCTKQKAKSAFDLTAFEANSVKS